MADLFFIIRIMLTTVVIVILMQIKIGSFTLEDHAAEWARQSRIVEALRGVSAGAVKALTEGYKSLTSMLDAKVETSLNKAQVAGSRSLDLAFEHSQAFVEEQTRRFRNSGDAKSDEGGNRRKSSGKNKSSSESGNSVDSDSGGDNSYGLQPESTYD